MTAVKIVRDRASGAGSGFTLVEIVISLVIFGFAALPVLSLFSQSSFTTKRNQDYLTAIHICNSALEGLMLMPVASIQLGSPSIQLGIPIVDPLNPTNTLLIPSTETHNATVFTNRLAVNNVNTNNDPVNPVLSFSASYDPGSVPTVVTVLGRLRRYDFSTSWVCRMTGENRRVDMTTYKADLR